MKKGIAAFPISFRHTLVKQLRDQFPCLSTRQLCDLLGVSRSWFYQRPEPSTQLQRDIALRDEIERIVLEFSGYGYRRVTEELHRRNRNVNHKCVLRVMRSHSLLCQLQRSWITTTDSNHALTTYPNLTCGLDVEGPNQVWVAEIV